MDKQNLETITMGRGSSMPCLKENYFFINERPLTIMHKRNKGKAGSY
jgi:hypothetical protein